MSEQKMKVYEIEGIFLDMGQGHVKRYKQINAMDIQKAIEICYNQYLTIEILNIRKVGEKLN